MKDGKPEEKKVKALIGEFEEYMGHDRKNWRDMIHDFIFWLYIEKEFIIIPQDKMGRSCISDIHLK